MNRILVSGVGLGKSIPNLCGCWNYDLFWLFSNPSSLLWIDKIIVTPLFYEKFKNGLYSDDGLSYIDEKEKNLYYEAIKIIFESLEDNNILEVKDVSKFITESHSEKIIKQIKDDLILLNNFFPESINAIEVKNTFDTFTVEGEEFCIPKIWEIYASLYLSKKWNANLLFRESSYKYLKYKFGIRLHNEEICTYPTSSFKKILSARVPEFELLPDSMWCKSCNAFTDYGYQGINSNSIVERNIKNIMKVKNYDELYQLRCVLEKISRTARCGDDELILDEFKSEEFKINKRINKTFPRIERWANVTTILSLPVLVAGVSMGSSLLSSIGAGVAGVATSMKHYTEVARSKYQWIGFKIN